MATSIQADVASFGTLEVRDRSYIEATISAAQSTNIGAGDHIKFDTARVLGGGLITLDTTTPYVNTQNTASVGRFALTGRHTYRILFRPTYAAFSAGAGSKVNLAVWDSDSAAVIGQTATFQPKTDTGNTGQDGTLSAYFAPSTSTRIEIRFVAVVTFTSIGVVDTQNYFPTILIESID